MASFYSVLYKRVLLLQRLNPLYSLAFSVKYCIRRPCVASHGAYCTFALSKRNFPSIYLRNNADCAVLFLKAASPIQARFESTTPVTPKENQSRLQQFKKILYNFTQGVKQLYNDVRATFKIRRKLKAYNWNYSALSRKEHWTMFKVVYSRLTISWRTRLYFQVWGLRKEEGKLSRRDLQMLPKKALIDTCLFSLQMSTLKWKIDGPIWRTLSCK